MGNSRHHGYDSGCKYSQRECIGHWYLGSLMTAVTHIRVASTSTSTHVCIGVRSSFLHDAPCHDKQVFTSPSDGPCNNNIEIIAHCGDSLGAGLWRLSKY